MQKFILHNFRTQVTAHDHNLLCDRTEVGFRDFPQRDRAEVVVNIAPNHCLSTKSITECHKHDRKSPEYGQSVQNSNTDSLPHLLKETNGEIQMLYGSQLSGEAIPRV